MDDKAAKEGSHVLQTAQMNLGRPSSTKTDVYFTQENGF